MTVKSILKKNYIFIGPFNAKVKAQPLINVNRSGKLTTLNMCLPDSINPENLKDKSKAKHLRAKIHRNIYIK